MESDNKKLPRELDPNGKYHTEEASENKPSRSDSENTPPDGGLVVKLPVRASVLNVNGEKVGKVRGGVWYEVGGFDGFDEGDGFELSDGYVGEFVREEDNSVSLYFDKDHSVHGGYVDGNNNVLDLKNEYIATLRYSRRWVFILVAALFIAAVLCTSLFAALCVRSSENGPYYPSLFVADDGGTEWNQTKNLPVFANPQFGDSVIAPGLTGSYKFVFRNDNADALAYNIAFSCENDYGIRVGYKLFRDSAVIAGAEGYVTAEDLTCNDLTIEAGSSTRFELEWRWLHDDETDTVAGRNSARYTLNIALQAWVA